MKKLEKGFLAIAALAVFGTNISAVSAASENELAVEVNGKPIQLAAIAAPAQKGYLLPLREVAENLGFEVTWNTALKAAEVRKGEIAGQVKLGDAHQAQALSIQAVDHPSILVDGNTYVSMSFVEEVMQAEVTVTEDAISVTEEEIDTAPPVTGTVTKIMKKEDGSISFLLNGYETGIILHISDETKITGADGKELTAQDLKLGMKVEAVHPNFMALSMPPQAGAITIVVQDSLEVQDVLGTAGKLASVETTADGHHRILVEGEALNEGAPEKVVLVVDENTEIVNARDQQPMKAEELKPEMKVYAFYGPVLTRSMPPQGVAQKLVVEIPQTASETE
ncbi:stalk domain-containing protein [Brevibacillus sp. TJ4]|uniref:stalk domain-containing protein n=1 Tax=Brevibacillus sp. TJ4 TaxID=3234853 RepID=UPI003B9F4426